MKRSLHFPKFALLLLLSPLAGAFAETATTCPALIILERTTNRNRVWYTAETSANGDPISAKWEMIEKGPNRWEPLTGLEIRKAYGIKMLPARPSVDPEFVLVSVPKIVFQLRSDDHTGCPYASYSRADGPEMNVQKIHLTMKKSLIPSVSRAVFLGKSMNDDRELEVEIEL
jgi:hypothetical protein